jgi:hypothetical protein
MATVRTTGRRIVPSLCAALVATATILSSFLVSTLPARADPGCNFGDLVNDFVNAATSIGGSCPGVCDDPVACAAAAAVAASLGGVGAAGDQNAVNTFCGDVSNLQNNLPGIQQGLSTAGISGDVASALEGLGDPLNIAQCACDVEQGAGQLSNDIGACLQDIGNAICSFMTGSSCTCSPSPPQIADCSQLQNTKCETDTGDPTNPNYYPCFGSGANGQTIVQGYGNGTVQNISPYPPAQQSVTAAGTVVSVATDSCGSIAYCVCPKPMVPTWTPDPPEQTMLGCDGCAGWAIFSCDCPSGTYPDPSGKLVNGIPVCLCNGTTNEVANLSSNALFGMCPPPACPTGQIRLTGNGNCVTPCSDPTKGMTMDGACCDPTQVTACGQCCPPGTIPDPTNRTCIPKQIAQ